MALEDIKTAWKINLKPNDSHDRYLLLYLCWRRFPKAPCFDEYLSTMEVETDICRSAIKKHLKILEAKKLITVIRRRGKEKNTFYIHLDGDTTIAQEGIKKEAERVTKGKTEGAAQKALKRKRKRTTKRPEVSSVGTGGQSAENQGVSHDTTEGQSSNDQGGSRLTTEGQSPDDLGSVVRELRVSHDTTGGQSSNDQGQSPDDQGQSYVDKIENTNSSQVTETTQGIESKKSPIESLESLDIYRQKNRQKNKGSVHSPENSKSISKSKSKSTEQNEAVSEESIVIPEMVEFMAPQNKHKYDPQAEEIVRMLYRHQKSGIVNDKYELLSWHGKICNILQTQPNFKAVMEYHLSEENKHESTSWYKKLEQPYRGADQGVLYFLNKWSKNLVIAYDRHLENEEKKKNPAARNRGRTQTKAQIRKKVEAQIEAQSKHCLDYEERARIEAMQDIERQKIEAKKVFAHYMSVDELLEIGCKYRSNFWQKTVVEYVAKYRSEYEKHPDWEKELKDMFTRYDWIKPE